MATQEITMKNFEKTVEDNSMVLLDFWAEWCGPCKQFGPIFEDASNQHSDVVFGKVNTEEAQDLAGAFQIRSIPTTMGFKDGVLVFEQPGLLPQAALEEIITKMKALDMDEVRAKMKEAEADQSKS